MHLYWLFLKAMLLTTKSTMNDNSDRTQDIGQRSGFCGCVIIQSFAYSH
jgi:hypothetical protein